jgi:cellulose synthase operon protein C
VVGWSAQRPPWQVLIRRSADAVPVGAGLLCTDAHVVTCTHVLAADGLAPAGPVFVQFQFLDGHEPISAEVIEGGWHPPGLDGAGDVAVLTLQGGLPVGAEAASLCEAEGCGGIGSGCMAIRGVMSVTECGDTG